LIPNVFSQPENIQVLSSSWYINPQNAEYLSVVAEVQNVGPNIIDYVRVIGTFYASDGTIIAENSDRSIRTQILPQQKTPLYMLVSRFNSSTGDFWDPQSIGNLTVLVSLASPTESSQYQNLEITSHTSSTNAEGYYVVTGFIKNTGTQSPSQVSVVATFYNSTGSAVAIGYYDLAPNSIAPGNIASFTIYPLDYSAVVNKIASYSLLIQAPNIPSATPTPSPSPTPSPIASPSPSPTPTETENGTDIPSPNTYAYIAGAVIAIVIVIGILVLVRRKRVGSRAAR
jgi:hypothetical protein